MTALSSLSTEYVRVRVSATEAGEPVDPTSATVEIAFVAEGEPAGGEWQAADWETDATTDPNRYYARVLVGPAGTVTLADGSWTAWVKVTGLVPEIPVFKAPGRLTVT